MKNYLVIIGLSLAGVGCASNRPTEPNLVYQDRSPAQRAVASALVLDPPITAYTPNMNLDRTQRVASAYAGYETSTTTVYTRFDDRQYYDNSSGRGYRHGGFGSSSGYVDRQTIVQTVGVVQR